MKAARFLVRAEWIREEESGMIGREKVQNETETLNQLRSFLESELQKYESSRYTWRKRGDEVAFYKIKNAGGTSKEVYLSYKDPEARAEINKMKYARFLRNTLAKIRKNQKFMEKLERELLDYDLIEAINLVNPDMDGKFTATVLKRLYSAFSSRLFSDLLGFESTCDVMAKSLLKDPGERRVMGLSSFEKRAQDTSLKPEESTPGIRPYSDKLEYDTGLGFCVRSKSELLICMILVANDISFKYEEPLVLDGKTYYPDFTITLPSGETAIFEHFGYMGDETYRNKTRRKIAMYASHGYYPGVNFFATYEFPDRPFKTADIEDIVKIIKRQTERVVL